MSEPLLRRWQSLLRVLRTRLALSFLFFVLLPFIYPWRGRTEAQLLAARNGYLGGLWARITDAILWKRAVIGGLAVLMLMTIFVIAAYHFSIWAHSDGQRTDRSG